MPAKYEHVRDSYIAAGKPVSLAKKLAAMTYNAQRPRGVAPVTGASEGGRLERILRTSKR